MTLGSYKTCELAIVSKKASLSLLVILVASKHLYSKTHIYFQGLHLFEFYQLNFEQLSKLIFTAHAWIRPP